MATKIRAITKLDIPGLNRLPPLDWTFSYEAFLNDYLREPYFHAFVMVQGNKIIGTGNVFHKDKIGWLANIIIDADYRGNGLGTEMTQFLVDVLKSKGCESQILLATELGAAVYKKIGFETVSDYLCFDSEIDKVVRLTDAMRNLKHSDLPAICQLDLAANGEDRTHLIGKYYNTGIGYFSSSEDLLGFYLPDFSRGLVLANAEKAGKELLHFKHSKKGIRSMLPEENTTGITYLEQLESKKGTSLARMVLGKPIDWKPEFIYSYGGGYCG